MLDLRGQKRIKENVNSEAITFSNNSHTYSVGAFPSNEGKFQQTKHFKVRNVYQTI